MTISNKELINRLTDYFMEQDKEAICRSLANAMIDLHRVANADSMGVKEAECLLYRLAHNSKQLMSFAKNGPSGSFSVRNIDSGDWE